MFVWNTGVVAEAGDIKVPGVLYLQMCGNMSTVFESIMFELKDKMTFARHVTWRNHDPKFK